MASKRTPGTSTTKLSKEERRTAAREKARALKAAEAKRAKRNKIIGIIVSIVVAIAVIATTIAILTTNSNEAKYGGTARPLEVKNVDKDYGISVNSKGEAGKKEEGKPEVAIYADFRCPFCQQLELANKDAINSHSADGSVNFKFYPVNILRQPFSDTGAAAMFYTATYAPEIARPMFEALMEEGAKTPETSATQATPEDAVKVAKKLGMKEKDLEDMAATITSSEWVNYVSEATQSFGKAGYNATPTVTVDGKKVDVAIAQFPQMLADVAAGKPIPPATQ
ncbi:protein-disulfide isomerase [Arcanobacterium wilhelmae]|uniref:Protein-disulfide isomerase n=1 Tax=Arcanobacterium wilhelmae TaxID=1803177 RepID=A0ABT9NBS4_9ACTO|nr:thioredoxin domain-containing protein [Arcanobacterium wilhelmae]MDP9801145.1 protein-disulfide isomerase [Arcanobacterium wilhelmae]WFN90497.1 thioredoxin domain-containing protein [Arcanobacterium wilhelmae]